MKLKPLTILYTIALACCALAAMPACTTVSGGRKVDPENISRIKKGTTTKGEVLSLLGKPSSVTHLDDGRESLNWAYFYSKFDGFHFDPAPGLATRYTQRKYELWSIIINKDGVVEDIYPP